MDVVEVEEALRNSVSLVTIVVMFSASAPTATMDCVVEEDVVKIDDAYCVVPLMTTGDSKAVPLDALKCESLKRTNGGADCRNSIAAQLTAQRFPCRIDAREEEAAREPWATENPERRSAALSETEKKRNACCRSTSTVPGRAASTDIDWEGRTVRFAFRLRPE